MQGKIDMKKAVVYGIVLVSIVIAIGLFIYFNYPFSLSKSETNPSEPEINMRQKMNDELSNGFSILEYDWVVWSKIARDSGMIFTRMDTWEQFKEGKTQSLSTLVIMLDQQSRVVWFKAYANHVIFYEY